MRGIIKRFPYIIVLLSMALYVGVRLVPHHHCNCGNVETVHIGYGECRHANHTNHEHNSESEGHDCPAEKCCEDVEFCRYTGKDFVVYKKFQSNETVACIFVDDYIVYKHMEAYKPPVNDVRALPVRHCSSLSLRAPPAL